MKQLLKERTLRTTGVQAEASFGIDPNDAGVQRHIAWILREGIYNDPIEAVVREYVANGYDANHSIGRGDTPLQIQVPTIAEPVLRIRDFGPGMSQNFIFGIYTQYGKTTKSDDDSQVGCLGLGCKSGFAYSETFTVVSWFNGVKSIYQAVLDESDMGRVQLLFSAPSDEPSGVEIQITARPQDIHSFQRACKKLLQHLEPRPKINIELPPTMPRQYPGVGFFDPEMKGAWVGVMGCVPYPIDIKEVKDEIPNYESLIQRRGGVVFQMGEVDFTSSREGLRYSKKTKAALVERLTQLFDAFIEEEIGRLKSSDLSEWGRRILAGRLSRILGIPLPRQFANHDKSAVTLLDEPAKTFRFTQRGSSRSTATTSVAIASGSKIWVRDSKRALAGYSHFSGYLVLPRAGYSIEEVVSELNGLIQEADLVGIPVGMLSSLPWTATKVASKSPKYSHRTFRYMPDESRVPSKSWVCCEREDPSEEDPILIINRFIPVEPGLRFKETYRDDCHVVEMLGGEMPPIYGIKSTARKPVEYSDVVGVPYAEWRVEYIRSLLTQEQFHTLSCLFWLRNFGGFRHYSGSFLPSYRLVKWKLGQRHILTRFMKNVHRAQRAYRQDGQNRFLYNHLRLLLREEADRWQKRPYFMQCAVERGFGKYPLIDRSRIWHDLTTDKAVHWLDYMSLMERECNSP